MSRPSTLKRVMLTRYPIGARANHGHGRLEIRHERHADWGKSALEQREFVATHGQSKREARRELEFGRRRVCEPHPKLGLVQLASIDRPVGASCPGSTTKE